MSLDVYLDVDVCPHCRRAAETVFSANITHNLNRMAQQADIYEALWRPEEIAAVTAEDIAPVLRAGIKLMKSDPDHFRAFDAPNGWGLYDNFVPWVERYLAACEANPTATIRVSR